MIRTMWKLLFGLILAVGEISSVKCVPQKLNLSTISKSQIRVNREQLEQQHHADFLVNEDIYRKWPELHEGSKYYCLMFLRIIFPNKRNLESTTPRIQKVILNYKYIRDRDNNLLTPKRVTALECQLPKPVHRRKLIYFMRSPQSPKCVFFLNKVRRNSLYFYIVQDVCEYCSYPLFWKYAVELEEEKQSCTKRKCKQKVLLLPDKEMQIKHAELEQNHFEYCSVNTETCKMWPEVQINPEYECKRFFRKIFSQLQDILVITGRIHPVTLHYLEISDENNGRLDPAVINAVACKLRQPIIGHKYIHFIRAPSYPSCVYLVIQGVLITEHVCIAEEICNTPNFKTSFHKIIFEYRKRRSELKRRITPLAIETRYILQEYENLHIQDCSMKQTEYEEWPELQEIDIKSRCQTILENVFPEIANIYGVGKLIAKFESIKIRYEAMSAAINKKIPKRKVKALECLVSEKLPTKRFHFIRTSKPDCVYWVKQKREKYNVFIIVKELCKQDAGFSRPRKENFGDDDIDLTLRL